MNKTFPYKISTVRNAFAVPGIASVVINDVMVFDATNAFNALQIFMRVKGDHHARYNESRNFGIMIELLKDGEIVAGYNDKAQLKNKVNLLK